MMTNIVKNLPQNVSTATRLNVNDNKTATPKASSTTPIHATSSPSPASSTSVLKADEIFGMMKTYLDQGLGKDLIPKIASSYAFEITRSKGGKPEAVFEIDLKNG